MAQNVMPDPTNSLMQSHSEQLMVNTIALG